MAVNFGRLEALITVPTGGWGLRAFDDGGIFTATITAGTYYMTTFLAEVKTQLDASGTVTWTVTIADGEAGTGKVTISATGALVELYLSDALTDDEVWQLMGYTETTKEGTTSHTSEGHARMIWLPDGTKTSFGGDADGDGWSESDARSVESPSGHVKVIKSNRKDVNAVTWHGISRARARIAGESSLNTSFEKFWEDAIQGEGPGGTPGGPVNLYWDADTSTKTTFAVVGAQLQQFTATLMREDLVEYWRIPLDRLVVVPA